MKILGVKFKNINSLAGEWEIRFDRSPIADTGLFAIVGPNGSGKTSILDAITLGLYGETARLRGSDSGILNLQGKDAYAEVTFSVMDHPYCSMWSVQKNGEHHQPPEMTLFSLNGEKTLLESRPIPVRNRIAALTGLDFKRFCRSILLAQGEFTAFLNALENERAEILEKIIGPEMLREMEESIRTRAEIETERLNRLKEEAAGFPTPDRASKEEIRQSMEQAQEDLREIDRDLDVQRYLEAWLERAAAEPMAEQDAADALAMAEVRYAEAQKSVEQIEQARPAGIYREALTQVDALNASSEAIQGDAMGIETRIPDQEGRLEELNAQRSGIRKDLDAAREDLAARIMDFADAAALDRDIVDIGERFLEKVSRLEAIPREQRNTSRKQSELEETERTLVGRLQELQQWAGAHTGEENLASELPAMDALLVRFISIRQQKEECRSKRGDAQKAESRTTKALRHAEAAVQKARTKADRLQARKTDRDLRLQAVFAGETKDSLLAAIRHGIHKLAVCKSIVRIGRKAASFGNIRDELAEIQSRMVSLTETLSTERSRLQALEGQIRHRDTVRRFDPDRELLQPGEPCPLCGAPNHPFLENAGLDFTELDGIVREREEKIRALQVEFDSLQAKESSLQTRIKALDDVQQEWDHQCVAADETWTFGDTTPPLESIRTLRKEIASTRSKLRSGWWHGWRTKWTDRSLGRKLKILSKRESLLEQSWTQHETRHNALVQIDDALKQLDENENSARSELSGRLLNWQEQLPEPGSESTPVERLRARAELYSAKHREQCEAADELELLRTQRAAFSEILQRLEEELGLRSAESESIQTQLNALKADRQDRFGDMDPGRERQAQESQVEDLSTKEQALSAEAEVLAQGFAADREALQQLRNDMQKTRQEAEIAAQELLKQSSAAGFGSLKEIRDGLSILQGEQEMSNHLAGAGHAVASAREALAALLPKYTTHDSIDTVRWKIVDAVKRQKELEAVIDAGERTLEQHRQAEREYRDLLQAIIVQEKAFAEAVTAQRGIDGQGGSGGKLQHLLLTHLLDEANRHLTLLSSGRYALRPAGENDLGLHIEDALQARSLRSVKTLSGGESFLVSLCLALGLSDMAGRHSKIESLFLDEGFGVLDDEMLYKVMSALKGLRANGKTIGIVSHVKRLAQEIPTQIRLEKEPDGSSRITVVA